MTLLALAMLWSLSAAAAPAPSRFVLDPGPLTRAEARERAHELATLGRALFSDPTLSGSGKVACATCHSPDHAFGPPNGLSVQLAGSDMRQPGVRAVPSLRYLQAIPAFTGHFFDSPDETDESVDNGPTGGLNWDGRANRGSVQARFPLLSPFEMANADAAAVAERALAGGHGPALARIYGADILQHPEAIMDGVLEALEVYQQDWRDFYPYSSKYDAWLARKAKLTPAESRGLALFNDEDRANCAGCHISEPGNEGTPPQFTDFGLIAIGVPRNPDIPANADPGYYDLGVCGPYRTDLQGHKDYCGLFRTPSLRNVATRKVFFHNGVVHDLRKAVAFYAERDTNPELWYPRKADGTVDKFNDLPKEYWPNLNDEAPFDGHQPGDPPVLTDAEVDDIVAFLETLTDGWKPQPAPDAGAGR
jgi:cytochrome c peroxidase